MKEHIPPLTPTTMLFQHVPVKWNGDLINFTTEKISSESHHSQLSLYNLVVK